ncbi:hypothetical protein ATANTOWER_017926 [Ataeniobius toweri]|uniref:Uncharacterized protein n=1 Tax=Ataeniobius toweri TaxID=208326 RepID=A0ABU7ALL6_9TELE|nr:hypothetical protein [Ataeniobius toweri]
MELLHLLRSRFLRSTGSPTLLLKLSSRAFPPDLSPDSPRALSVPDAKGKKVFSGVLGDRCDLSADCMEEYLSRRLPALRRQSVSPSVAET